MVVIEEIVKSVLNQDVSPCTNCYIFMMRDGCLSQVHPGHSIFLDSRGHVGQQRHYNERKREDDRVTSGLTPGLG